MSAPFVLPNLDNSQGSPRKASDPQYLRAGDTWLWGRYFDGYRPIDGWVMDYRLNSSTAFFAFPPAAITATADGAGWAINVSSAETAAVEPGTYELVAVMNNLVLNIRETLPIQSVRVSANLADATAAVDTRSFVKKTLDAIEARIAGNSAPDVLEYEIAGRRLSRMNPLELKKLRDVYRYEYQQELVARGEYVRPRQVRVSFGGGW